MEGDCRFLLLAFAFSTLLAAETIVHALSSDGFLNIACGKPKDYAHTDAFLGLTYTSDAHYIDTGESHKIASSYISMGYPEDLRSFPTGSRNCYTLKPIKRAGKYLVRAYFMYGNYDGQNRFPKFDLYLGVNFWDEVSSTNASSYLYREVMAVATSDAMSLCLVNIDEGMPFISYIEVRPLSDDLYPLLSSSQALRTFWLGDPGGDDHGQFRYPYDIYDRTWSSYSQDGWRRINASSVTATEAAYQLPSEVMRTASTPISASYMDLYWRSTSDARLPKPYKFFVAMHLAELEPLGTSQSRVLDIYINGKMWHSDVQPVYLKATTVSSSGPEIYDRIDINVSKTGRSTLPPLINAVEVYRVLDFSTLETDGVDADAMLKIKEMYKLKKNWMGDPCAPEDFRWDGLNCSYVDSINPRVISLNLSSHGLTGEISQSFGNLTQLQHLDLSNNELTGGLPRVLGSLSKLSFLDLTGNHLAGPIPKELHERIASGTLKLRIENLQFEDDGRGKNWKVVVASVAGSISFVLLVLAIAFLLFQKRVRGRSSIPEVQDGQQKDDQQHIKVPDDPIIDVGSRQFSRADLANITRKFATVIGKGGFGLVYLGVLEGGTNVAVKVLKASSQGQKQFQNEAVLLSKIHHRNLVSLFGYCNDPGCLALVYEYMEEGSIHDHLSGKRGGPESFGWKKRVEIAIGAAQGLEYLHEQCTHAIVHRDIKTQNILLDRNMEAKIGDFGLSKIFQNDIQTYVTTMVMGTPGYLDPEYTFTQKLNKKSDVYSFGIVLLQLVTGLPAIIRGNEGAHIVDYALPRFQNGAIEELVDKRFDGNYNINSIWEAIELALACASRLSTKRPTMADVVKQLKVCLSLEDGQGRDQSSNPYSMVSMDLTPVNEDMLFNLHAR